MFMIVITKKNQANAFVDIRKRVGPRPICCAIFVGFLFEQQEQQGAKNPRSSHNENRLKGISGASPSFLLESPTGLSRVGWAC